MEKKEFESLYALNVNDKTEQKNGLTYLSWAWAWAEFKKHYPNAEYQIWKDENGKPYIYDESLGYMVYTRVSVDGLTHEMWLPVMDSANFAMKDKPYEVKTKYKTVTVKPATMMDINKTIMRCLTKNLAMFGLGLYIYAGEDLPEDISGENAEGNKDIKTEKKTVQKGSHSVKKDSETISVAQASELRQLAEAYSGLIGKQAEAWLAKQLKVKYLTDVTISHYETTKDYLTKEILRKNNETNKAEA